MCRLRAAVQRKLHGGFHWTELYLGALLALLGVLGAALLYWEWQQHKRKKDQARTAENLRFNADTAFLKRLIGQVRLISTHGWQAIPCAAHSCREGQAAQAAFLDASMHAPSKVCISACPDRLLFFASVDFNCTCALRTA